MTQAIMPSPIEASKADMMTIREADNLINNATPIHIILRLGGPALKTYIDWEVAIKYQELCDFEIDVKNIFMTKSYNTEKS